MSKCSPKERDFLSVKKAETVSIQRRAHLTVILLAVELAERVVQRRNRGCCGVDPSFQDIGEGEAESSSWVPVLGHLRDRHGAGPAGWLEGSDGPAHRREAMEGATLVQEDRFVDNIGECSRAAGEHAGECSRLLSSALLHDCEW